jgi:hypothetical protein
MILRVGSKILACHRRLYDGDQPRYFVGEVVGTGESVIKATGYSFVRDLTTGKYPRKEDVRTKIISLTSGAILVYELPREIVISSLKLTFDVGHLLLTDGVRFVMDLAELPHEGKL